MRTNTYERWLQRTCSLIGLARADLQTDEELNLREWFNTSIRRIWQATVWPQVTVIEERTPASQFIDYEQSGQTKIDTVLAVYDADPDGTTRPSTFKYRLSPTDIQLVNTSTTSNVWVEFRKRCPDYTGDDYATATTYAVGDQVYYPTTGDFYECIQAGTGNLPSDTAYWTRLTIPHDFLDYCAHAAYADWLRNEGENERALAQQKARADDILADEIDKVERQQGFQPTTFITTHLSAQST